MGEQAEFVVGTVVDGKAAIVVVQGEVDLVTAPQLERALCAAAASGATELIVDLSGTSFLDSSGIHALLRGGSQAGAGSIRLALVGGSSCVRKVLEIAGVDRLYEVHETLDEARQAAEAAAQPPGPAARQPRMPGSLRRRAAGDPAPL